MSKKLYIGILTGIAAGAFVSAIINYNYKKHSDYDNSDSDENDILESANEYLLMARSKAEKIVKDAEEKSHSIIIEAGKLLALSKENTDLMYNKLSEGLTDEANEIKVNMEKDIEDFRKKL